MRTLRKLFIAALAVGIIGVLSSTAFVGPLKTFAQNVVETGKNYQLNSLGVGTPATGTPGALSVLSTVGLIGTITSDTAAAGSVGELLTSSVTSGVNLTTATAVNLTSLALTPGDWDCSLSVQHLRTGTATYTGLSGSLSNLSATVGTQAGASGVGTDAIVQYTASTAQSSPGGTITQDMAPVRVAVSNALTLFAVVSDTFTSTMNATGTERCRRVR